MKRMKKIFRITGISFLVILALVLLLWLFVYFSSERRINREYKVTVPVLNIPADSASIEKGKHVMLIRGCSECHGADGAGRDAVRAGGSQPGSAAAPRSIQETEY